MNSFLRFIGLVNAAIWLGAVVVFTACVEPACHSSNLAQLLGAGNFPYYSGAISQLLIEKYFLFLGMPAAVALLHLVAEWLYMGRPARNASAAMLLGLLGLLLVGGSLIEPHMAKNHALSYAVRAQPGQRESAARAFRVWKSCHLAVNVFMICGLIVYVWRLANPTDAPRFISSVKFRG